MRSRVRHSPPGPHPVVGQRRGTLFIAWLLALCAVWPARAADAPQLAADPVLEARMTRITAELRCLVCQNQTIADSNADLAVDLRRQVREMLRKGDDDATIVRYMTDRYGDFVLYRPPVKSTTWLLWFGPALMLLLGFGALALVMRRRARAPAEQFEADDPALFADPHQS